MDDDWIRKNVRCCACGGSLEDSKHINLVALDKVASWKFPTWGNVLTKQPLIHAVAIVCDKCIDKGVQPKFAVEWNDNGNVKYHKIEELPNIS